MLNIIVWQYYVMYLLLPNGIPCCRNKGPKQNEIKFVQTNHRDDQEDVSIFTRNSSSMLTSNDVTVDFHTEGTEENERSKQRIKTFNPYVFNN